MDTVVGDNLGKQYTKAVLIASQLPWIAYQGNYSFSVSASSETPVYWFGCPEKTWGWDYDPSPQIKEGLKKKKKSCLKNHLTSSSTSWFRYQPLISSCDFVLFVGGTSMLLNCVNRIPSNLCRLCFNLLFCHFLSKLSISCYLVIGNTNLVKCNT